MLILSMIHIEIANLSSPHIPQEEGLTRQSHPWRRTNLRLQEEEERELPKPPAPSRNVWTHSTWENNFAQG